MSPRHGGRGHALLYPTQPSRPRRAGRRTAQKGIAMARRRQLYEGKAKILFEGPGARHPRAVFQGRRHRLQRPEEGRDHRQGRAEQPHQRIPDDAAGRDRHPDPFRPPPEHARAAHPRGGDHSARGGGPQRRRRQPVEAARHPGGHTAAALDHRVLLQERCARGPDRVRGAHHLLRLGQRRRYRRHRGADACGSTTS